MINLYIQGATRRVGASQGYLGISVLYGVEGPEGERVRNCTTAWEPTPTELSALNQGAALFLTTLSERVAPMRLFVGSVPAMDEEEYRSEKGVPLRGRTAFESGWDVRANPHPERTPERLDWIAAVASGERRRVPSAARRQGRRLTWTTTLIGASFWRRRASVE